MFPVRRYGLYKNLSTSQYTITYHAVKYQPLLDEFSTKNIKYIPVGDNKWKQLFANNLHISHMNQK